MGTAKEKSMKPPCLASIRTTIESVIEQNRSTLREASARGTPAPSCAAYLRQNSYVPDPVDERVRGVSSLLATPTSMEIEDATAWRMAELLEKGEAARFEFIAICRGDGPYFPQSILIIRGDGRFENPLNPHE